MQNMLTTADKHVYSISNATWGFRGEGTQKSGEQNVFTGSKLDFFPPWFFHVFTLNVM